MSVENKIIKVLTKTQAELLALNPVLLEGQRVYVSEITGAVKPVRKYGDGVTPYNSLMFMDVIEIEVSANYDLTQAFISQEGTQVQLRNTTAGVLTITTEGGTEDLGIDGTDMYRRGSTDWILTGRIGAKGDGATVIVNSTTTGSPGTSASVVNSGTPEDAELDFTIPRGDVGAQGDAATVAAGTTTTGAPGSNASVVNSGDVNDAVFDFTIPEGDKGDAGNAATIAAGTTTTGAPGTSASVVNSGSSSAAVFDFTIPEGDKGDKGDKGDTGDAGATFTVSATIPTTQGVDGDMWLVV